MARVAGSDTKSVSDLLSAIELRGQAWCYSDLGKQTGFSVPPGDTVLFHAVIHGSVRIACASGGMAELGPGDAVMVLSGEAHALRTSASSPARTHEFLREDRVVDIPPTIRVSEHGPAGAESPFCARMLSGRLRPTWPVEVNRTGLPAMLRIDRATSGLPPLLRADALPTAGIGFGSAALLTKLAAMLLVAGLRADPRCRQLFSPPRQDPIGEALRLIEATPSENWTVERLARSVGMGRSNFAAHFTQQVGRAPMEVVAEQRMEHAAGLLRQGRLKIAEISEMAGYGSEAAFSRRFTRHFGISPSQMRERARTVASETQGAAVAGMSFLGIRTTQSAPPRACVPAGFASPRTAAALAAESGTVLRDKRD